MKFPFPIKCHSGLKPYITQGFGGISRLQWYRERGITFPFHNGVDVVLGDPISTYGTELICTLNKATILKVTFDSPLSTKGNGVYFMSEPYDDAGTMKKLQVVFWHASEVTPKRGEVVYGDTLALIGNSGVVSPEPTPECPFNGSHLHLMVYEYRQIEGKWTLLDQDNGVGGAQDPLKYFDVTMLIAGGKADPLKDIPPVIWGMQKKGISGWIERVLYAFKVLKI